MAFPETITRALAEYDHKRRKEASAEESASITAVKNLAEIEQNNPLAILGCFSNSSERRPAETHLTYSVYVAAIQFVFDELFVGEKEILTSIPTINRLL